MTRQRFVLLLAAALVAISGAFYFSTQRNLSRESEGALLLPSLAGDMNSVTAVIVRKDSKTATLTVHKAAAQWTVAERGDYPADVAKLRTLLLTLRDAKIVEEKTSDPARYAVIGVEDPAQPGSAAVEITLIAPSGKHALIVGKPVGEGNFVRRDGEKRSYSAEPAISVETEPRFWIDSRLIDVPAALIERIEVKPAAGAAYVIRRLNPDNAFSLDGAPAGRKSLDEHALAPAPTTLTGLNAEEVSPAADIDFSQSSQAIADKHWLQLKSSKDAALTAKVQGRAFEVASYRYDAIFKPLEQLLQPKESPAPKSAASGALPPAPPKESSAAKPSSAAPLQVPKKPRPAAPAAAPAS
jgi:hypothetical protein